MSDDITSVRAEIYEVEEIHTDCTVQLLRNVITGEISVGWWRNDKPPVVVGGEKE